MSKRVLRFALAAGLVLGTVFLAMASSHREAPLISADPLADNTDVYAFVSPDAPSTVTLIANWIPLEAPGGGPNFYKFGDDVLYRINIDNDGDAQDDIVYEFRFKTTIQNQQTFLYNTGPIGSLDRSQFQRPPELQRDPLRPPRQEGARDQPGDAARKRRRAFNAELRGACEHGHLHAAGRVEGVRRPARRSVLRGSRIGVRSPRAATPQPGALDSAASSARCRRAERA